MLKMLKPHWVNGVFRFALLAVICTWGVGDVTRASDRVVPKQGVAVSGKIVEITPAVVTIEVRGKNQNFDVADLLKVEFDDEPTGLSRARENYLNGQFDQALDEIKKVDVSSIKNPLVRQDVEFYRYYCEGRLGLTGAGDKEAAIKGLLGMASTNRSTHHLFELSEMLGELAMAVGQPAKATSYFSMLLSSKVPDTQARGAYRLAQLELSQGKTAEAQKRFNQLVNSETKTPEMARLKNLAEVGLSVCDHLAGDSEGALRKLDALIAKNDSTDQELFARIYNAKGACFEKLGRTQDALLSYLKTDLLFFTEAEAHAEALYHLKKLWPQTGNAARAAEAGSRLVQQYASSSWANKP